MACRKTSRKFFKPAVNHKDIRLTGTKCYVTWQCFSHSTKALSSVLATLIVIRYGSWKYSHNLLLWYQCGGRLLLIDESQNQVRRCAAIRCRQINRVYQCLHRLYQQWATCCDLFQVVDSIHDINLRVILAEAKLISNITCRWVTLYIAVTAWRLDESLSSYRT